MESESQIKQIEKYNNQLFYKLFSKFPKIKKTKQKNVLQSTLFIIIKKINYGLLKPKQIMIIFIYLENMMKVMVLK